MLASATAACVSWPTCVRASSLVASPVTRGWATTAAPAAAAARCGCVAASASTHTHARTGGSEPRIGSR